MKNATFTHEFGAVLPSRAYYYIVKSKEYVELAVDAWDRDIDFWEFDPSGLPASGCRLTAIPTESESGKSGDSASVSKRVLAHQFVHRQDTAIEHVTFETLPTGKLRYRVEVTLRFKYL